MRTGLPPSITKFRKAAKIGAIVRCLALIIAFVAVSAAMARASTLVVLSDSSWLAKNSTPGAGWNTNTSFNTAADGGWVSATVSIPDCNGMQDCIWYDGMFSTTEQAYFRKTFFLDGPAVFGSLSGGIDDDGIIWVNGVEVYNVFDGLAQQFGPIDITSYLVAGENLIAVFADDNLNFGNQHTFHAQLNAETALADPNAVVPEPASILLFGSGLTGLIARRYRRRSS
jgi:hypothetical protein